MSIDFSTFSLFREKHPLVHAITNFVTANFCADVLLAAGASPMITDDPREAADATRLADALYLNIGTLNAATLDAMFQAGQAAKEHQKPIVFDPVGAGATLLRQNAARKILAELRPDVVKGNLAEMLFLAGIDEISGRGVDAGNVDVKQDAVVAALQKFALKHHLVAIATGKDDFITDGTSTAVLHNGCAMLERVTGTGCALGALCAACAANQEMLFSLQCCAVLAMSVAGEIAREKLGESNCGGFKMALLDAIGNLSDRDLQIRGKYEFLA